MLATYMAKKKQKKLRLNINRKQINTPIKTEQFPKGHTQISVNLTIKDQAIENINELPSLTFQINNVKRMTTQALVSI